MTKTMLPLLAAYEPARTFAWREGEAVNCGRALSGMQQIARQLQPQTPYINLCTDRYPFIVAFAAVGLAGGVNLLPQSHAPATLAMLRQDNPDALSIDDGDVAGWLADLSGEPPVASPALPADHCMAHVFTSGSTGRPGRHSKTWGALVLGAELYHCRFGNAEYRGHTVATVPPQHMYGLETSVMPALQQGYAVDAGRPFMPWAVTETLAQLPAPRLLITTPMHLRACLDAGISMPPLEHIISATAPLDRDLAQAVEDAWHCPMREIYGSTETGSVASRRTAETDVWRLYDRMTINGGEQTWLNSPQLPEPFLLNDNIEVLDDSHFRLLGRSGDMLKLAGKRMSINALTQRLAALEGVEDAVVFRPGEDGDSVRPAAMVVAPSLNEREVGSRLARSIDPIFVPRPLLCVDELPRNALGKLPRQAVLALFEQARQR